MQTAWRDVRNAIRRLRYAAPGGQHGRRRSFYLLRSSLVRTLKQQYITRSGGRSLRVICPHAGRHKSSRWKHCGLNNQFQKGISK